MFHLMVNSAMGDEPAVETILNALALMERPSVSSGG
jgi:hypothetical protein